MIQSAARVLLLRKHCEEFKELLTNQLKARADLGIKHRLEKSKAKEGLINRAQLIKQQAMEIFEFQVYKQETKAILVDRHLRELRDVL